MNWLPGILALLIAAAGWHYLFYSTAAGNLAGIEDVSSNRLRVRLRRLNGGLMIALGVVLYAGAVAMQKPWSATAVLSLLLAMMFLLSAVAAIACIDLALTRRLRAQMRQRRRQNGVEPSPDEPRESP